MIYRRLRFLASAISLCTACAGNQGTDAEPRPIAEAPQLIAEAPQPIAEAPQPIDAAPPMIGAELNGEYSFPEHPGMGVVIISAIINCPCASKVGIQFSSWDRTRKSAFVFDNTNRAQDTRSSPAYFSVRPMRAGRYFFDDVLIDG